MSLIEDKENERINRIENWFNRIENWFFGGKKEQVWENTNSKEKIVLGEK